MTDPVWSLIDACWSQEPASRPTIAEVERRLAELSHAMTDMIPASRDVSFHPDAPEFSLPGSPNGDMNGSVEGSGSIIQYVQWTQ
jgi:hypothetical protein